MIEYKVYKVLTAAPPLVMEAELNELTKEGWYIEFVDSGFIFLERQKEDIPYDIGGDVTKLPNEPELIKKVEVK